MKVCAAVAASAVIALASFAGCNGEVRFDEPVRDGGTTAADDNGVDAGPCTEDLQCASLGLSCDKKSGRCVACLEDRDCESGPLPHCSPTLHVCVACREPGDCVQDDERCDVPSGRCLAACDDDPCYLPGFTCNATTKLCVECATSADCATSTVGKNCDAVIGRCVECASPAQCAGAKPTCDRRSGKCVGCVSSSDCPVGQGCDSRRYVCAPLL